MFTLQVLPVTTAEMSQTDIGPEHSKPISLSINRVSRLWKTKTWNVHIDLKFGKPEPEENPLLFHVFRDIQYKNHKVSGDSETPGYEPQELEDLLRPRHTAYKVFFSQLSSVDEYRNPQGSLEVNMFSPSQYESVRKIGARYYPVFSVVLTLMVPEGNIVYEVKPPGGIDTRISLILDGIGIPNFSTTSTLAADFHWVKGTVEFQPLDFWY